MAKPEVIFDDVATFICFVLAHKGSVRAPSWRCVWPWCLPHGMYKRLIDSVDGAGGHLRTRTNRPRVRSSPARVREGNIRYRTFAKVLYSQPSQALVLNCSLGQIQPALLLVRVARRLARVWLDLESTCGRRLQRCTWNWLLVRRKRRSKLGVRTGERRRRSR